jgi:hypothetical protein
VGVTGVKTFDSAQSYFDTATAIVYCVLRIDKESAWDDRIAEINASSALDRPSRISDLALRLLFSDFSSLFLHEWHHVFQTIIYPQRYLQSARELRVALSLLTTLSKTTGSLAVDDLSINNDSPIGDLISSPHEPMYLRVVDGRLDNAEPNDMRSRYLGRLTEIDLLEESTSIFIYRMTSGKLQKGHEYDRWRQQQGSYWRVFPLLAEVMHREDAFSALPSLTLQAFRTTDPKNTFVNLVNATLHEKVRPSRMPEEDYHNWLSMRVAELDPASCDPYSLTREKGYPKCIPLDEHIRLIDSTPLHPCYIPAKWFWEQYIAGGVSPGQLLFHFNDIQNLMGLNIFKILPPEVVVYISHPGLKHPAMAGIVNKQLWRELPPDLLSDRLPDGNLLTYAHILNDGERAKNLVYGLLSDYERRIPHNCRHADCPYHPTEACRRWSPTPADWRQCTFPGYLVYRTNHLLNPATRQMTWFSWDDPLAGGGEPMPSWWQPRWSPPHNWNSSSWFSLSLGTERGEW